jgi:predicted MFS family arabinose efflux permease
MAGSILHGLPQRARLAPLVLATMASQALLIVLSPTIVAIGRDLGASVSAVGQARSVTAGVAIVTSVTITLRIHALGVQRLLGLGAALAISGCAAVAASPTLAVFLAAHALVGVGFACLLSAGFAGVAAFSRERRGWAIGYVAGANALAWIVVNPVVGLVTDWLSWRVAHAVPGVIALAALLASRAAAPAPGGPAAPRVRALVGVVSARRWIGAELIAYGAWTALLTFIGAFLIGRLGVREAAAGWLLASGAAAYFVASTRCGGLADRISRRRLVAGSALLMAVLLPVQLSVTRSVPLAVGVFCLIGFAAGIRTPASSGLGLEQLPDHPGAMMGARTAATQLGYLLGAVVGGAVIAAAGYRTMGFVLAVGMAVSAVLVLRVDDPLERRGGSPPARSGSRRAMRPPTSRRRPGARGPASTAAELRNHRARDQFELSPLISQRPQVHALAAGLRVTREKLSAVLRGTDANLGTKLVGISLQDGSQDVGEHAITLRSILRHPSPHRRERVGKGVRVAPAILERTSQSGTGGGEALRSRVVSGGEPAVTRPRDASETCARAPTPDPQRDASLPPWTRQELNVGCYRVIARLLGHRLPPEQRSEHGERFVESLPTLLEGDP